MTETQKRMMGAMHGTPSMRDPTLVHVTPKYRDNFDGINWHSRTAKATEKKILDKRPAKVHTGGT